MLNFTGSSNVHVECPASTHQIWFKYRWTVCKQERGCGVPNVLLIQLGGLEEHCKLPQQGLGRSPGSDLAIYNVSQACKAAPGVDFADVKPF